MQICAHKGGGQESALNAFLHFFKRCSLRQVTRKPGAQWFDQDALSRSTRSPPVSGIMGMTLTKLLGYIQGT